MKQVIRALSLAIVLTLVLTACGSGDSAPTPTTAPVVVNTPVPWTENGVPTVTTSELCTNLYWPIKDGAGWVYTSTGAPSGTYDFVSKIREVRADGFTIVSSFKKERSPQAWICHPEGLVPFSIVANNATTILGFRSFQNVSLSNINGVYLPVSIVPDQKWKLEFDFTATEENGSEVYPVTGHVKMAFTAGNNENVTIAAGSFDTLPITIRTVILYTVSKPTGPEESGIDTTYTFWFAPNVGWIKASGSGTLGGQQFFETLELIGFSAN